MFYPFLMKYKFKVRCSREECTEAIENRFVKNKEFREKTYPWGFVLIKRTPAFSLTFAEKCVYTVQGKFKVENNSLFLFLELNMLHNFIMIIAGCAFIIFLLSKINPDQILSLVLFLVFLLLVIAVFSAITFNQEKDFINRFERSIPVKRKF